MTSPGTPDHKTAETERYPVSSHNLDVATGHRTITQQPAQYIGDQQVDDAEHNYPPVPYNAAATSDDFPTSAPLSDEPPHSQFLLPVDSGKDAWLFLLGATFTEVLIWGVPFSVGVLHLYWTNTLFPNRGASIITLAATVQAGLLYMLVAIVGPLITAFPQYTKKIQVAGLIVSAVGILASAFVTEPWHLIITFGLLYPFASATYVPCATILFEWFSVRRGLAAGIMYAGTGIGGTIYPFIISGLINRFGYKVAMISLAVVYLILGSIALIPIKRRIPIPRRSRASAATDTARRPKPNLGFLKAKLTWIGFGIILVSSLGNYIPSLWLPAYADDLHIQPSGTSLVAIMNAASVPGNAMIGYLSDRFAIRYVILLDCLGTALACAFLWGFGTNAALLVTFTLVFGLLGLGFVSVYTKLISTIARDDPTIPAMAFSLFAVGKGIGSMSSGPIADALLKVSLLKGAAGGYGVKNYGILLIYTGVTIASAGVLGLAFRERK